MDPALAQALSEVSIAYGVPFALALAGIIFKFAVHHLPKNRQDEIANVAQQVVSGVEQMYTNAPGTGPAKKQEAIKLVKAMLGDLGLHASDATISVLIESAVRGLHATQAAPVPAEASSQPLPLGA